MNTKTTARNHAAAMIIANKTARKAETRGIVEIIEECAMKIADGFTTRELQLQGYSAHVIAEAAARQ